MSMGIRPIGFKPSFTQKPQTKTKNQNYNPQPKALSGLNSDKVSFMSTASQAIDMNPTILSAVREGTDALHTFIGDAMLAIKHLGGFRDLSARNKPGLIHNMQVKKIKGGFTVVRTYNPDNPESVLGDNLLILGKNGDIIRASIYDGSNTTIYHKNSEQEAVRIKHCIHVDGKPVTVITNEAGIEPALAEIISRGRKMLDTFQQQMLHYVETAGTRTEKPELLSDSASNINPEQITANKKGNKTVFGYFHSDSNDYRNLVIGADGNVEEVAVQNLDDGLIMALY
ncbi:MAG: hypothetical protein PHC64_08590 [Candidatus Gastranaerophilales bacterium]|nr:hypothetical protein [Candidatus Gastranaerophilales bacterium]